MQFDLSCETKIIGIVLCLEHCTPEQEFPHKITLQLNRVSVKTTNT